MQSTFAPVRLIALWLVVVTAPALAKNVELPPNVTLRKGNMSGDYIDTITQEARGAAFAKLKLCLAQNVSNAPVTITGGTDAPFSIGTKTQTSTIQGGDLFKYEDAAAGIVIAVGSADGGRSVFSSEIIRFELMAETTADRTVLKFTNIARVTQNTGTVTNSGFIPVGAWKGAKPLAVVETLTQLGGRIDACLQ